MKKILMILSVMVLVLGVSSCFLNKKAEENVVDTDGGDKQVETNIGTYSNSETGLSFEFPKENNGGTVEVIEQENVVFLTNNESETEKKDIGAKKDISEKEKLHSAPYVFVTRKLKNDGEITGFLQDLFGKECINFKKVEEQENFLTLEIYNTNETACSIGNAHIKYNPKTNIIVAWNGDSGGKYCNFFDASSPDRTCTGDLIDASVILN